MEDKAPVRVEERREENFPPRFQTPIQAGRNTCISNGAPTCHYLWGQINVCSWHLCMYSFLCLYSKMKVKDVCVKYCLHISLEQPLCSRRFWCVFCSTTWTKRTGCRWFLTTSINTWSSCGEKWWPWEAKQKEELCYPCPCVWSGHGLKILYSGLGECFKCNKVPLSSLIKSFYFNAQYF